ncbi:MAG: hypothetical protein BEN19_00215, partial [Epulopiscium sp. Nuni2H_MBin003]
MEDWINIFMPGRLCMFGEHSDWAASYRNINPDIQKGYAIVVGIDKGIYLKVRQTDEFYYRYKLGNKCIEYQNDIESIKNLDLKSIDEFMSYILSTYKLMLIKYNIKGAEIICTHMDLPIKKGLSSSSAICMAVIRSCNLLYSLNLTIEQEMELAYQAEQNTGSKCGRLDQLCAYGTGVRVVEFDGDNFSSKLVENNTDLYILLVDLNGFKDTKKILQDLNNLYPYIEDEESTKLYTALGYDNINIVNKAIQAMESNNPIKLGKLMTWAQHIFDSKIAPFSIENLKAPKLHQLIEFVTGKRGVLGT